MTYEGEHTMISTTTDIIFTAIEAICDLIFLSALFNRKFRDLHHPVIGLIVYFISGQIVTHIFPNMFGWITLCLLSYFAMYFIMRSSLFEMLMGYIIEYVFCVVTEDIFTMVYESLGIKSYDVIALACAGSLLAITFIMYFFVPLHRFFMMVMNGTAFTKFLVIHLFVIYIINVGMSKYSSLAVEEYIPIILTFAVMIVIADIILIRQQQTISAQRYNLENYETYQPMLADLIKEIRSRQHDFNNELLAIKMLGFTYKDYDSLSLALAKYTDSVSFEYDDSNLIDINMSIVSGFIYSKICTAKSMNKNLVINVHTHTLESQMPEYDIVRVLGILIDNALEAVSEGENAFVDIDSHDRLLIITTLNRGPVITNDLRRNMFSPGFTTKTNEQLKRGFGLYNMKKLVKQYNGKICLDNMVKDGITFIKFTITV